MCESYVSMVPSSLCSCRLVDSGPNEIFNPESSHVFLGMMRRYLKAKIDSLPKVMVWCSGSPKREFLFVDDLVDSCLFLLDRDEQSPLINIGSQDDVSTRELAELISEVVDYEGKLAFDTSKPDEMTLKKVDTSKMDHCDGKSEHL